MDFPERYRATIAATFFRVYIEQLVKVNAKNELWSKIMAGEVDYRVVQLRDQSPELMKFLFLQGIPRACFMERKVKHAKTQQLVLHDMHSLKIFFGDNAICYSAPFESGNVLVKFVNLRTAIFVNNGQHTVPPGLKHL